MRLTVQCVPKIEVARSFNYLIGYFLNGLRILVKEWEPIEICETDPDYSEKMSRYGAEGYQEYNYK